MPPSRENEHARATVGSGVASGLAPHRAWMLLLHSIHPSGTPDLRIALIAFPMSVRAVDHVASRVRARPYLFCPTYHGRGQCERHRIAGSATTATGVITYLDRVSNASVRP